MDPVTGESGDYAGYSTFLLHQPHHRCRLPLPPVSAAVHCERQFLQLFQQVDHAPDAAGTTGGGLGDVDRLSRRHQAAALTCDEENSTSSNDSVSALRSNVKLDISTESRDTASDKLTRLQRPEHRQVVPVHVT